MEEYILVSDGKVLTDENGFVRIFNNRSEALRACKNVSTIFGRNFKVVRNCGLYLIKSKEGRWEL